jgi:hypothetical protein
MIVKVFLTLEIDEDDYPFPVDGDVTEEVDETMRDFIYDVDGMEIKTIKILTE